MSVSTYCYVRVSSQGQTQGHGPKRQREIVDAFAKANGYHVVRAYEDAHTGTEADRPAFMEMLGAMMSNGVKVVIIESLDRLARDLLIQSTLIAKLGAEGLTLIAANTGEDITQAIQDDPMRKAMVQIQGVFAELDKSLLTRKLAKARKEAREEHGRCEGRKPFGHKDGESAILDRIRQLRRKPRGGERPSFADTAEALNNEGHPTRTGKGWTRGVVHKICRANSIA